MEEQKNNRKYLWIYAVILFASAFTVLLLTAFSQTKLNNNIEEYKTKLKENESNIKGINLSLNSAAQEKKNLQKRIEELELENNNLKSLTTGTSGMDVPNQIRENSKQSFDSFLDAKEKYDNGDLLSCAQDIRKVNEGDLGAKAKESYSRMKDKAYLYATKEYYRKGKELLKNNDFLKARSCFEESLSYDVSQYYEENTYYFIGYTSQKLKDPDRVKQCEEFLTKKYPNSEFIEKLNNL